MQSTTRATPTHSNRVAGAGQGMTPSEHHPVTVRFHQCVTYVRFHQCETFVRFHQCVTYVRFHQCVTFVRLHQCVIFVTFSPMWDICEISPMLDICQISPMCGICQISPTCDICQILPCGSAPERPRELPRSWEHGERYFSQGVKEQYQSEMRDYVRGQLSRKRKSFLGTAYA